MTHKLPKRQLLTPTTAHEIATEIQAKDPAAFVKIGSHVTNGKKHLAVHVAYLPGDGKPYTIGSV